MAEQTIREGTIDLLEEPLSPPFLTGMELYQTP